MKKFGFTLAELLITMGIIAIVAAITAPALDSIIPDKNKAKVLKAYKTISNINADLLNDPSIYMTDGNCSGIDCTNLPSDPKYSNRADSANFGGLSKYGYLLADKLNIAGDITSIAGPNGIGLAARSAILFDTTDGLHWQVRCTRAANPGAPTNCSISITTNDEPACQFGNCNNGRFNNFSFEVRNSGRIAGQDALTRAYLMNPTKLNDKRADLAKASELANEN